jgi:hypothetical protein
VQVVFAAMVLAYVLEKNQVLQVTFTILLAGTGSVSGAQSLERLRVVYTVAPAVIGGPVVHCARARADRRPGPVALIPLPGCHD